MKRILLATTVLLLANTLHAQSRRTVELGIDALGAVSNNFFAISDFWNNKEDKTLSIDLNEMARKLSRSGLTLSADAEVAAYLNLNLSKDLSIGLFLDTNAYAYTNLPGDLLSLMANGNVLGESYSGDVEVRASSFASTGVSLFMRTGGLGISFVPSYFMPIAMVRDSTARFDFSTDANQGIRAAADILIPVYSAVPVDQLEGLGTSEMINMILANGGLDFTLAADYQLTKEWKLGVSLANIPILPAALNYKAEYAASFNYEIDNILDQLMSDSLPDFDLVDSTSYELIDIVDVLRPFKIGVSALYTPDWFKALSAEPMLGLGIHQGLVYIDFGLKTQLSLGKIFTVKAAAERRDRVWYQHAGFILNAHLIELEALVGMSSGSFLSSYTARGLYAMIGLRIGI